MSGILSNGISEVIMANPLEGPGALRRENSTRPELPAIDCAFPGGNIVVEGGDGDTVRLHKDLSATRGDWLYW